MAGYRETGSVYLVRRLRTSERWPNCGSCCPALSPSSTLMSCRPVRPHRHSGGRRGSVGAPVRVHQSEPAATAGTGPAAGVGGRGSGRAGAAAMPGSGGGQPVCFQQRLPALANPRLHRRHSRRGNARRLGGVAGSTAFSTIFSGFQLTLLRRFPSVLDRPSYGETERNGGTGG